MSKSEECVALINSLAQILDSDDAVQSEEMLYSVHDSKISQAPKLPMHSLATPALFTNSKGETNLSTEINREVRTADSVDLLCAFIKTSGLAVLREQLEYMRDNGIPFRVLTLTYYGATDELAVRRLVEEYGAQVKVCYETENTRLHAKAWMFHRKSGFDTVFVGSSNLSNSALVSGWEWNIRGTSSATPEVLEKFSKTFEGYWFDEKFKEFDPT